MLCGLKREHHATEQYGELSDIDRSQRRQVVRDQATAVGVQSVSADRLSSWLTDPQRTTYLLDVRTPEEFERERAPHSTNAPGGQLVQGTDEWIGVRGARVILIDDDGIRAPMCGYWLAQMGHSVFVVDGGLQSIRDERWLQPEKLTPDGDGLPSLSAESLKSVPRLGTEPGEPAR